MLTETRDKCTHVAGYYIHHGLESPRYDRLVNVTTFSQRITRQDTFSSQRAQKKYNMQKLMQKSLTPAPASELRSNTFEAKQLTLLTLRVMCKTNCKCGNRYKICVPPTLKCVYLLKILSLEYQDIDK